MPLTQRTRRSSPSLQVLEVIALKITFLGQASAQSFSSSMPSVHQSFWEVCYYTSHPTPKCPLFKHDSFVQPTMICSGNMQKSSDGQNQERPNCRSTFRGNRICNREHRGLPCSEQNSPVSETEKALLPRLSRNNRIEKSLHECPQYNNSSDKRATGDTVYASCTTSQESPTDGMLYEAGPDAFTRIHPRECISTSLLFLIMEAEWKDSKKRRECAVLLTAPLESHSQVSDMVLTAKPTYNPQIEYGLSTSVVHTATLLLDTGSVVNLIHSSMISD